VKRERKSSLSAAELRAIGTTPDLVTRRLRLASLDRANQTQAPKDAESKHSRCTEGGG